VVILAGGLGTRISEESHLRPKPMIEIGLFPVLWHIMKIYSHYGLNDFIICCGYKGYVIKEYFANYFIHNSDITFNLKSNKVEIHSNSSEPWSVTCVDTGSETMTGGRIKRIKPYLDEDEDFCLTYGDGVGDINISELINFHKSHNKLATVTATKPPGRFGQLSISGDKVESFIEKPIGDGSYINGGFFVLHPKVVDYISDDKTVWEKTPLEKLAKNDELLAYIHEGFWQPMDTLRDKNYLESLWNANQAPWKVW
ncbi:MAG: glucose-1-phosphate cytidylyltransferase, partial [Bdellovibrionales bacterium]|nr:glucose-1-phosphate cytidylyltransferase [Bdellovibrionales bacterium]